MKGLVEKFAREIELAHLICECGNPECAYKKKWLGLKERFLELNKK